MALSSTLRALQNQVLVMETEHASRLQQVIREASQELRAGLDVNPNDWRLSQIQPLLTQMEQTINERITSQSALASNLGAGVRASGGIVADASDIPVGSSFHQFTPVLPLNSLKLAQSEYSDTIKGLSSDMRSRALLEAQKSLALGETLGGLKDRLLGTGLRGDMGRDGIFRGASWRAETIARTVTNDLVNRGAIIGYTQLDGQFPELEIEKLWQTASDRRTSSRCQSLSGQVKPLDELFQAGDGWTGANPPAHPNCRSRVGVETAKRKPGNEDKWLAKMRRQAVSNRNPEPVVAPEQVAKAAERLMRKGLDSRIISKDGVDEIAYQATFTKDRARMTRLVAFPEDAEFAVAAFVQEANLWGSIAVEIETNLVDLSDDFLSKYGIKFSGITSTKRARFSLETAQGVLDAQSGNITRLAHNSEFATTKAADLINEGATAAGKFTKSAKGTLKKLMKAVDDYEGYQTGIEEAAKLAVGADARGLDVQLEIRRLAKTKEWQAKEKAILARQDKITKEVEGFRQTLLSGSGQVRVKVDSRFPDGVKDDITEVAKMLNGKGFPKIREVRYYPDRAYYDGVDVVYDGTKRTLFHEVAHSLEIEDPELFRISRNWIEDRATGPGASLNAITKKTIYDNDEYAFPDHFLSPYVGKIYPNATEVWSMGVERLSSPSHMLKFAAEDPEHFNMVVGLLKRFQGAKPVVTEEALADVGRTVLGDLSRLASSRAEKIASIEFKQAVGAATQADSSLKEALLGDAKKLLSDLPKGEVPKAKADLSHVDFIEAGKAKSAKFLKKVASLTDELESAKGTYLDYLLALQEKAISTLKNPTNEEILSATAKLALEPEWVAKQKEAVGAYNKVSSKFANFHKGLFSNSPEGPLGVKLDTAFDGDAVGNVKDFAKLTNKKGFSEITTIDYSPERASYTVGGGIKTDGTRANMFHEMAHALEAEDPNLTRIAKEWVQSRATGAQQPLNEITGTTLFKETETAYPDSFISPYVGKFYPNSTEVWSVGIERLATPASTADFAAADPEHFQLVLGLLEHFKQPANSVQLTESALGMPLKEAAKRLSEPRYLYDFIVRDEEAAAKYVGAVVKTSQG